jgi:hypothetical protein
MKHKKFIQILKILVSVMALAVTGIFGQSVVEDRNTGAFAPKNLTSAIAAGGCNDGWDTTFTTNGVNGTVNVIVTDGAGNFYIGGNFTSVQGVPASGIAKWDGTSWSSLGSGIGGSVYAIAFMGDDLYVGGGFSTAGGVPAKSTAKWDGSSWSALGEGLGQGTHYVKAVAVFNNEVYFGGNFSTSDGSPFSWITKWDGNSYLSAGSLVGDVNVLALSGGLLYAGGSVAPAPGNSIGIAKFDGTTWSSMGTLDNTVVKAIAFSGSTVYVVGSRIILSGQSDSHVAKFDGTTWTRLE